MKKTSIIFITLLSLVFNQNQNTYIWSGSSISIADNLDALNLNPAGLGFNRGEQQALIFKNLEGDNNFIGLTSRFKSGFAYELYYDNSSYISNNSSRIAANRANVLASIEQNSNVVMDGSYSERGCSAYALVNGSSWEEAQKNAEKLGGTLTTPNNQDEN